MKIFRCQICGEAYIGNSKPSHCPYCGAHDNFLILASEWKEENIGLELSQNSKEYLQKALKLELDNAAFYKCISKTVTDPEISGMFKFLGKVEAEHASVFKKMLGLKKIDVVETECFTDIKKDLEESSFRENRAINFYREVVQKAPEKRIKTVFAALIQIETDHFNLAQEKLKNVKE
ncbi:ferritin [bacterium CG10_big_fil_rev_8_21_14_0_10_33_18]|nr:MAG: ferritin [bacterium CG10_big_fil_rev_8_21_14_0_10_33_18]